MVFSSLPFYLDPPPPNWQHQQQHQQGNNGDPQLPPLPPPPHGGVSGGIRPGSMAGARLAKIPLPEPAQKCPRCDSTNTKFCYFNNYSLSQPRHFCKACRRYWTRGGAIRNVPVGGGCRRNKKTKNNSSKSSSSTAPSPNSSSEISGSLPQQTPHFPFLTSLPNFSQFGNVGLNFPGIHGHLGGGVGGAVAPTTQADLGFQVTNQHQQQFPFFENPTGMYPFPGTTEGPGSGSRYAIQSSDDTAEEAARVSEMAPVKTESSNNNLLNLSRRLGIVFDNSVSDLKTDQSGRPMLLNVTEMSTHDNNNDNNQHQFWGGNNWGASDLSGTNQFLH